jgi:hypothetical protein
VSSQVSQRAEAPVDVEEIEIAEWVHFVREWREALATPEQGRQEASR